MLQISKTASDLNVPENLVKVMLKIDKKLNAFKVPHAIIGGIAVGGYSKPRTTKDIDFLISTKDIDKIKNIFPQNSPLLMEDRVGITTIVDGIDVDFICHEPEEIFLLEGMTEYHGVNIPGKTKLLYLKLTSE